MELFIFIWTGNYKETILSNSVNWKPRKTSKEQALSRKREKKPGDQQSPHVHALGVNNTMLVS